MPANRLPSLRLPLLATLLALAACRGETPAPPSADVASSPDGATADAAPNLAPAALRGRVGAHWFGRQWPKNWLAGFRREHVDADFAQLAADGFDTVVLLVAWGDFQPVAQPCCTWDERAFERLRFVLERADAAGLKVMLRVGYGWSFHPDAGDVGERQQQLLNRPEMRAAYQQFLTRLGAEIAGRDEVVMAFMSWEDQWLRRVDASAAADYAEYLAQAEPAPAAPAAAPPPAAAIDAPLPDPASDARRFHGYWDWLVREKLYAPAVGVLPNLSYEARIDREPVWGDGADGQRSIVEWLPHDGMFRAPEGHVLTIYWAPFWGALNQGEQLPAARATELLTALLTEARAKSGRALFVDQFNFVDNTPGHESNAVLKPDEIPAFLHRSVCTLRAHDVAGYALWTARDYAESPLYNPAFGYGLDGWTLRDAEVAAPATALESLPSGDFRVRMVPGRTLAQDVPARHGRLPRAGDALADRVCVEVEVHTPGRLSVVAGGEPAALLFAGEGTQRLCADLDAQPAADHLPVALTLRSGDLAIREVQVFDHVQYGGVRDADGVPGPLLDPVRRMNADFRADVLPPRCAAPAAAPAS